MAMVVKVVLSRGFFRGSLVRLEGLVVLHSIKRNLRQKQSRWISSSGTSKRRLGTVVVWNGLLRMGEIGSGLIKQ